MVGKRMRHMSRYRDIAIALIRHGFGIVVEEIGFAQFLSLPQKIFFNTKEKDGKTIGERIRLVLQELGPTFVKLGQIASTRPDLLPEEIIRELEKLQDQVPPFSFEEVRNIVQQELGADLTQIFRQFADVPLAAASIGQVHQAILHSGEKVAVKIQRPNIANIIETDLEILQDLATLAERRLEWAAQYQICDMVDEFSRSLRAELDYTIEARNAEKISNQFKNDPGIHIPKVFWEYSTKKVLTMEYVEGIKFNELERLKQNGYNLKKLADRLAKAVFQQIFVEGFFHGDPHPGNVLVLPGEVIAFIDFGMVGRLNPEIKYHFSSLVIALMNQSTDGVIKSICQMGLVPDDVNIMQLRDDVEQLREKYYRVSLSKISLGEAVNDLFRVAFRHSIRIPRDLTLLGKTLLTVEGMVEKLDPDFRILDIAEPFGRRLLKERLRPKNIAEMVWKHVSDYREMLIDFPKNMKEFASLIKQGKLHFEIDIPELDHFLKKLDQISNRLSFSIVLLSFSIIMVGIIIGSSMGRQSTLLWKIPAIEIGFGVAALMFVWLLYSIFKSGRF
ncbi:2-polyprenylphenol 6-hydroxylase [Parageobacillus thermoglucosidasius]|uniref:2-polyprenylphenol 6-hydroxylase n=1 Tax=Parageobacillus thermoglucosidasius TaxID=1426 RepID=A0AAN0YP50_PARTM|nr:2-polyprenylphenol 6-hydroxylase [Parageobacillus thermoglucosidasius]ALF10740.1 ABC transporter [Parageobacillus thermoglucosidasius]ANZ30818.1 2-polyprenylphenol 6-hydroxylase [Parageobacillus thermoglucosidasius]APM81555.1 2-polyprenylphenol 6-hydroxylase [Parageobacillus thermoglucosidasius]KJX69388.1 ABC transporter [Parageobacillus thermoglucosidasius]RDE22148.1 2-polyprenylphenol 6-hydroxylase [Parageobacillus thermoglucosidasius]